MLINAGPILIAILAGRFLVVIQKPALGFATWAFALRRTNAGRLAALAYLIPVVAILLGWLALGEIPPPLAAAGGALCLAGVAVARRR